MLIVWIAFPGLGSVPHYLILSLHSRTDKGTSTGGGDHLVAVETEDTIFPESSEHLAVKTASEALCCIFDDADAVLASNLHDPVDPVWHSVQGHGNDGLGLAAGLLDAVCDGFVQQVGVDIP